MDNPKLVAKVIKSCVPRQLCTTPDNKGTTAQTQAISTAPAEEIKNRSFSYILEKLQEQNLQTDTINIIIQSWQKTTQKQYEVYIKKWFQFCDRGHIHLVETTEDYVLKFLTERFQAKLSYSSINTARSAVSQLLLVCDGSDMSKQLLLNKFM